jgi:hypothetical protein
MMKRRQASKHPYDPFAFSNRETDFHACFAKPRLRESDFCASSIPKLSNSRFATTSLIMRTYDDGVLTGWVTQ